MKWEVGVSRYKLLYIEWINNKVQQYQTENYIQYPMINHNGKEYFKKQYYMCMKVKVAQLCQTVCNPKDYGQNTGVGSLSLLQGIFPTQGSNPCLPHCKGILYQLSHKESSRILEWVAKSPLQHIFLTQESNWGLLYCRQIFTNWAIREAPNMCITESFCCIAVINTTL